LHGAVSGGIEALGSAAATQNFISVYDRSPDELDVPRLPDKWEAFALAQRSWSSTRSCLSLSLDLGLAALRGIVVEPT